MLTRLRRSWPLYGIWLKRASRSAKGLKLNMDWVQAGKGTANFSECNDVNLEKSYMNYRKCFWQMYIAYTVIQLSLVCCGLLFFRPLKVFLTVCVQTTGFSLALGMVVHGLSMCGHGQAEDIHPHLLASWMKILLAEVLSLIFSFFF